MSLLTLFQNNFGSNRPPVDYDLLRHKAVYADALPRVLLADKRPGPMVAEALPRSFPA